MTQDNARPHQRKSAEVTLGLSGALALILSGCAQSVPATHQAVCVQQGSNLRVADSLCNEDRDFGYAGGYGWYYVPIGNSYARQGQVVSGGSFHPRGSSFTPVKGGAAVKGGVLSRGTTVSKGGFGGSLGSGKGFGGG